MWFKDDKKTGMPTRESALRGRAEAMPLPPKHRVFGTPLDGPFPGASFALFGLGCFWGAERKFWQTPGVVSTAVGYAGGYTPNPTYEEVCSGSTGHNEVVRVAFDPSKVSYSELVRLFFEVHDPTQGMRQGNDVGTQYRSGIYPYDAAQKATAVAMKDEFDSRLTAAGFATITTEIADAPAFYFAEPYHQQYLDRNPDGYCALRGTGVSCPIPDRALGSVSRPPA